MQTYTIDASQTVISAMVRRVLHSRGRFARVAGTVQVDENGAPRAVEVSVDSRAFRTGIAIRDAHLRTAEFLDAGRYPLAVYTSQDIEAIGQDHYTIRGQLLLRGQARSVALQATVIPGVERDGARHIFASGVVSRAAFGIPSGALRRRSFLNAIIGDEVYVTADMVLRPVHEQIAADASGAALAGALSSGS